MRNEEEYFLLSIFLIRENSYQIKVGNLEEGRKNYNLSKQDEFRFKACEKVIK